MKIKNVIINKIININYKNKKIIKSRSILGTSIINRSRGSIHRSISSKIILSRSITSISIKSRCNISRGVISKTQYY